MGISNKWFIFVSWYVDLWSWRMHNEKGTRYIWFILVSETMDLILNWTFTYQINHNIDPHLEQSNKHHTLGFTFWETMLYVLTIISLFCGSHNDFDAEHSCMASFSLLSTVTEDLPQTFLAINVARRLTHLISGIDKLKAINGVIEPIIRITNISKDMIEKNITNIHACTKCLNWFNIWCGFHCNFVSLFLLR